MNLQDPTSHLPLDPEQRLRGFQALAGNPFYRYLVETAEAESSRLLLEVRQDLASNVSLHYKQIGEANGIDWFCGLLEAMVVECREKAKEQRESAELAQKEKEKDELLERIANSIES